MPNSLGVEELGMPNNGGACGMPREKRRERKRGHGESPKVGVHYWLDDLEILGEVSLNRYED